MGIDVTHLRSRGQIYTTVFVVFRLIFFLENSTKLK